MKFFGICAKKMEIVTRKNALAMTDHKRILQTSLALTQHTRQVGAGKTAEMPGRGAEEFSTPSPNLSPSRGRGIKREPLHPPGPVCRTP